MTQFSLLVERNYLSGLLSILGQQIRTIKTNKLYKISEKHINVKKQWAEKKLREDTQGRVS